MKIKKFNVILATMILGGVLVVPSTIGLFGRLLWQPFSSSTAATTTVSYVMAGAKTIDDFSSEGKQVVSIPWRTHKGEMPGKPKLCKWVDGNRTYYEVSGPVNPQSLKGGVHDQNGLWGRHFVQSVYFERGGNAYDQWIINPNEPLIFHFNDTMRKTGENRLPSSRFQIKVKDNWITVTFWCPNNDTPRNIAFHYSDRESIPESVSWVATDTGQNPTHCPHHQSENWTDDL